MKQLTVCLSVAALLASCSEGAKKLIVISEGTADINTNDRVINVKGRGHEEKTVMLYGDGSTEFKLNGGTGSNTLTFPENGTYIVNAKKDTIVGSYVNYGAPKTEVKKLTAEEMHQNIDSLEQIVNGKTKAGATFFILPGQAVKITSNNDAYIVTPYHQMTTVEKQQGKTPEVYRFYPISETRATLERLKSMMGEGSGDKPVNDPPKKD